MSLGLPERLSLTCLCVVDKTTILRSKNFVLFFVFCLFFVYFLFFGKHDFVILFFVGLYELLKQFFKLLYKPTVKKMTYLPTYLPTYVLTYLLTC